MEISLSTVLLKLKGSRIALFSSFMAVGCIVYLATDWLMNKRERKQSRQRIKSGRKPRIGITASTVNGIEQLELSIKTIENVLAELASSDITEDHELNITLLQQNLNNLKKLMKERRLKEHPLDVIVEDSHLIQSSKDELPSKDLKVASSEKSIHLSSFEDDDSICSDDSFVSATEFLQLEVADEAAIDEDLTVCITKHKHLELYQKGIAEYKSIGINVRKLRTEMLHCQNDADFRIRVYCIRKAFQVLFEKEEQRSWFLKLGRDTLLQFLIKAGKDCSAFEREFDLMISYCENELNWHAIEEELRSREVCEMTFYDIVLDFLIMDAFEDLENPPSTLVSIINNGWISNSIKETALSTAVWSLLKAKASLLKNPDAFMSKMYQVSQHITPVLVWGFLGPVADLKRTCQTFKDALLGFLVDIFSMDRADYSTSETLANDILEIANERAQFKGN